MTLNPDRQEPADHRGKYTGIKIISQGSTRSQNPATRYFEEQREPNTRIVSYNGTTTAPSTAGGKVVRERGYETLREKKVVDKYPM